MRKKGSLVDIKISIQRYDGSFLELFSYSESEIAEDAETIHARIGGAQKEKATRDFRSLVAFRSLVHWIQ